ncbi:MAG: hypothetical protein Q4C30_01455 [Bacteroidia bacterium]|nr:hypothetical protein [Bacteroidia bacterium]
MKVEIRHKYKTYARREAREQSTARVDGRSVFIKRYPGNRYHVIMVYVTEKQRTLRDIFAEANRLAKSDMTKWNRVRHWSREARRRGILGCYRAAVSFYYRELRRERGEGMVNNEQVKINNKLCYWVIDGGERAIDNDQWIDNYRPWVIGNCWGERVWRLAG